jgi:endonuclease V-like protein UPF0215 family
MRSLHLEKKGIRCLAIAESFRQNSTKSILSGIVMRRDFLIDGFVFGNATLEGNDATDAILKMYYELNRPDVNYVLISGLIVSLYNIIDIKKLFDLLKVPIIGVTYHDSHGIESSLKHHFPNSYLSKLFEYKKLDQREKITLKTNHDVFVRLEGCTFSEAEKILNDLTLQGSYPEPLRVSQLLSKTLLRTDLSF